MNSKQALSVAHEEESSKPELDMAKLSLTKEDEKESQRSSVIGAK
jgi:hypothetical protein